MLEDYLIVHKKILPDFFDAVLKAKTMLDDGSVQNVSQAAKAAGISRSTFYKYKDYILETSDFTGGRHAVMSMVLTHETGILSSVLATISKMGASVLTITQSLPVRGKASVTISVDISGMKGTISELTDSISSLAGVEKPKLVAVE